jgi:hypothetical protein
MAGAVCLGGEAFQSVLPAAAPSSQPEVVSGETMTALLIAWGALFAAVIARALLETRPPPETGGQPSATAEDQAEEDTALMEAIIRSYF